MKSPFRSVWSLCPRSDRSASVRRARVVLLVLAAGAAGSGRSAPPDEPLPPPVVVDYFYEAGCPDCLRIRDRILPELEERFRGLYDLRRHDITVRSNALTLVRYQEVLGTTANAPVSMVLDYRRTFHGYPAIEEGLFRGVEQAVAERLRPGWTAPAPIARPSVEDDRSIPARRMAGFTWAAVLAAGLADGINPCAMGTLVFFLSVLSVSGVRGRDRLLVGLSFGSATFLTYFTLGLGLLRSLRTALAWTALREVVETLTLAALALLAVLSFLDAWRYQRTGDPRSLTLRLPDRVLGAIHRLLRTRVNRREWALSAFVAGAAVTVLEGVCTGQNYLPTLVLVASSGASSGRALALLTAYNAMFVVPLAVLFGVVYAGTETRVLVEWSRRHVVPSKIALGLIFLGMAAILRLFRS